MTFGRMFLSQQTHTATIMIILGRGVMLNCRPTVVVNEFIQRRKCYQWLYFLFSLFHDPDEGHKEFLVEAFENQSRRFPGGDFKPADKNWTDVVK